MEPLKRENRADDGLPETARLKSASSYLYEQISIDFQSSVVVEVTSLNFQSKSGVFDGEVIAIMGVTVFLARMNVFTMTTRGSRCTLCT